MTHLVEQCTDNLKTCVAELGTQSYGDCAQSALGVAGREAPGAANPADPWSQVLVPSEMGELRNSSLEQEFVQCVHKLFHLKSARMLLQTGAIVDIAE